MQGPESRLDVRLVPAAVAAWAVTAAGVVWDLGLTLAVLSAGIGISWASAGRWLPSRVPLLRASAAGVLGVAVVGAGFGVATALRSDAVRHHPLAARVGQTDQVSLTAVDSPRPLGSGRLLFRGDLKRVGQAQMTGAVVVFAPGIDFGQLSAGQPVTFRARIARPARRDLTVAALTAVGPPQFGRPSTVQRAAGAVRQRFAAACRATLPADQAAMLPGLVLGDTAAVSAATTAEFRTAGLTHLTAVSGANVTIVCGAVLLSAGLVGPRPAVVLAALALVAFVVVVQPTASVLRAAVMGAISLMAVVSGRRRQAVPVLAATVLALLVAAPQLAVDLGFALSVSATAALVVLAPIWSARLVSRGWPKPLAAAVCVAAAAQLVTAPLVAAISGRFSVVSVLANLVVALVIPPITVIGTAAAALVVPWPAGAELLIRFTGPEVWWLLWVARTAAALPGAAVAVPTGWAGLLTVGATSLAIIALVRLGSGRLGSSRLGSGRWWRLAAAGAMLCAVAWSVSGAVGGP